MPHACGAAVHDTATLEHVVVGEAGARSAHDSAVSGAVDAAHCGTSPTRPLRHCETVQGMKELIQDIRNDLPQYERIADEMNEIRASVQLPPVPLAQDMRSFVEWMARSLTEIEEDGKAERARIREGMRRAFERMAQSPQDATAAELTRTRQQALQEMRDELPEYRRNIAELNQVRAALGLPALPPFADEMVRIAEDVERAMLEAEEVMKTQKARFMEEMKQKYGPMLDEDAWEREREVHAGSEEAGRRVHDAERRMADGDKPQDPALAMCHAMLAQYALRAEKVKADAARTVAVLRSKLSVDHGAVGRADDARRGSTVPARALRHSQTRQDAIPGEMTRAAEQMYGPMLDADAADRERESQARGEEAERRVRDAERRTRDAEEDRDAAVAKRDAMLAQCTLLLDETKADAALQSKLAGVRSANAALEAEAAALRGELAAWKLHGDTKTHLHGDVAFILERQRTVDSDLGQLLEEIARLRREAVTPRHSTDVRSVPAGETHTGGES